MTRFDFFFRAERSVSSLNGETFDQYWSTRPAHSAAMDLPEGTDVHQAITSAIGAGVIPRGSSRGGCFEVQGDAGIWNHIDERRIDGAPEAKIVFTPWDPQG